MFFIFQWFFIICVKKSLPVLNKNLHASLSNGFNFKSKYFLSSIFYFTVFKIFSVCSDIGLAVRVFANGPGDLGSIPGRVIPKTQKMVLDASLLNTQHYKVRIKGKVEQSWERSSALPYTLVPCEECVRLSKRMCKAIEKGAFGSPSTKGRQLYIPLCL